MDPKLLSEYLKLTTETLVTGPHICLSNHQGTYKLYFNRIRYIEMKNRQLCFHYNNDLIYLSGHLKEWEKQLPISTFFRCNNSYIVNVHYVEKIMKDINRYSIYLITGEIIPLSRDKKNALSKLL